MRTRTATMLGLATLWLLSCSTDNGENVGLSQQSLEAEASEPSGEDKMLILPPNTSYLDVTGLDAALVEARAQERTAFDENIATQAQAVAEPAPSDIEIQLEAAYQASLRRSEDAQIQARGTQPVDFDILFENIRATMPPARGLLLMQYVAAARLITDATEQTSLLKRLSSPELDNVR